MRTGLDILNNIATRRIYNLCFKEGLSKQEISYKLYGKWLPNAVLPKIAELEKAGFLELQEIGKNVQRKRGKYYSTMLPIFKAMKTQTDPHEEELGFLQCSSLKNEFFRINKNMFLDDDWIFRLRVFLDDLMLFRLVNVKTARRQLTKEIEKTYSVLYRYVTPEEQENTKKHRTSQDATYNHNSSQNNIRNHIAPQSTTNYHKTTQIIINEPKLTEINRNSSGNMVRNQSKSTQIARNSAILQYSTALDTIIQEIVRKHGEYYETKSFLRNRGKPLKGELKTDYACLSLLMPESLCLRIEFTSVHGQIFAMLERNKYR